MPELKQEIENMNTAFAEFKSTNDARLDEIEKKGAADALTEQKLSKINDVMDDYKDRMDTFEAALNRPDGGSDVNAKQADEDAEYKDQFNRYLKSGFIGEALEKKQLSAGTNSEGGYVVTPHLSATMIKGLETKNPIRQLASVETISTDTYEYVEDIDEASVAAITETATRVETATPVLGKSLIPVFEMYAYPKATTRLLDDAYINMESWLAEKMAKSFRKQENIDFIIGDGTTQSKGILSYAAGTSWGQIEQILSGSSGAFDFDDILDLVYALDSEYAANGSLLMNRSTAKLCRKLKGADGQYIWQPAIVSSEPATIDGNPVYECGDMPVAGADSLSIAYADFSEAYKVIDRRGVSVIRDNITVPGFVKFHASKRVGGGVVNTNAIKLLKLGA